MNSEEYTADCIKVTTGDQFEWVLEGNLAADYQKPLDFIQRGLEACRLAHQPKEYFIDRYLKADKTVERVPEVDHIYWELLKKDRR